MHGTLNAERRGNDPDLRRIGIHPDHWYPVAAATDLRKGKALGVSFAGAPIVLVRTGSNRVFALEDRCAHRQMPLSCGVVAGELIKCCYHAWSYNSDGRCSIPYLPKGVAMPRGVRAYPSREAYGLIFVFPGNPALAEQVAFPDLPAARSDRHMTLSYVREVDCHYSFMHENLMDMNHQFLHRRWLRKIKPTLLDTRTADGVVEVDYKFELVDGDAPMGSRFMLGERDPENRNYDIMTVSTQYPYQVLQLRRPAETEPVISLWSAYVPLDAEQRRNRTFGLLSIRKPKIPALMTVFKPVIRYFTEAVFAEDRFAVEAEQRAHDAQGADWNQEILPFIFDLRNMLIGRGIPIDPAAAARSGRNVPAAG
jgi:phenylpropionate dioxygenase-like ring-hydroxylating dioxygenase large terminal subunit